MNLTRMALARPVFILMLMMAALLIGGIAYKSSRLELQPDVSFPVVTVTTVYPGAGPEEVNNLVSKPIEDAVSGVTNLYELSSTSQEGVSAVLAQFELGTDVNVALDDVRARVDSVLRELPQDVERPIVGKFDNSAEPVLTLAFSSKTRDSRQLRDLVERQLADQFSQIIGVADVNVTGGDVREIQIQVDKNKLLAYGIGITDITRQIASAAQNVPGGRIIRGDQELQVRVQAQWESVEQIRGAILNISDPGSQTGASRSVKLTDVATVVDSSVERTRYSRLNGRDTVVMSIQKAREGNAVEITEKANVLIAGAVEKYPDLEVVKTFEQAKMISESLADLNFTLYFAILLVAAVVYMFLHNFRGTLIVAVAIPTCIFVALIAIKAAGFTINNMTMLALILAVGVLVDDAIVVLENIFRHLEMGEDPREAAINGRGEIGLAAIAITLADVVVFLPIAFMGGIVGQFFKPMALTYVFAVLASVFVSFTVTPMLAARWYRKGEDIEHGKGRFSLWFERNFKRLEGAYRVALEWALHHRWFVFILGNSALVAIFMFIAGGFAGLSGNPLNAVKPGPQGPPAPVMLFFIAVILGVVVFVVNLFRGYVKPRLILYGALFGLIFPAAAVLGGVFGAWKKEAPFKFEFIPSSDASLVTVNVEMPPGTSLAGTEAAVARIEQVLEKNEHIKYIVSNIGTQAGGWAGGSQGSNMAQIRATLYDKGALMDHVKPHDDEKLRWVRDTKVAADILEVIPRIPGAEIKVAASSGQGFGSPIQMSFRGDDRDLIVNTVEKIKLRLQQGAVRGVINPDLSSTPGKPELQAVPDRSRLADAGLTVADVGAATRALYQGIEAAKLRELGEEYDVRVQLSPQDRNDPRLVEQVPVAFKRGNPIYLSSVSKLESRSSLDKVERRDRQIEVRLTADLLPNFAAGSVQAQIDALIKEENLVPPGVTIAPLGQAQAQAREQGFLFSAFLLGLVLVYMLLASLYDNLLYPFIIQLAQPQAMTGAILALVLTDKSLNLVGFIGLITLVGLVGKNAILLVDYTNTLRARGRNRHDAIVEAGPVRLRPISMTTIALILGVLPIAIALGRGSEFRETIGIVIIGGMLLSTFMTLLVIPCSYTIFDDISNSIGRTMNRLRGHREKPVEHDSPEGGSDGSEAPRGERVPVVKAEPHPG